MNFDTLQKRVRRAENVTQARMDDTLGHWGRLDAAWRSAWTPGRIVVAGLAGGFLAGKLEPGGAFSGARWLQGSRQRSEQCRDLGDGHRLRQ